MSSLTSHQRGQVNHTFYSQINVVRTIEDLLGLPSLNQHDALAAPMLDVFQDTPDVTPYTVIPNQIPLDTLTPVATASLQKAWQKELAKSFSTGPNQQPDRMDSNLLNHAIWYATKGFKAPYPGEKKVLYPSQVKRVPKSVDADDELR